jgi:hypothetical protein
MSRSGTTLHKAVARANGFAGRTDDHWNLRFREGIAREGLAMIEAGNAVLAPPAVRGAGAWPLGTVIVDASPRAEE